jgi:glycosyltransferase involved in cell wall biosynthesis
MTQKRKRARSHTLRWRKGFKNPLVSILTVCRNSEKTIAKTIESVLNQTYHDLEYIIVDGASTDGTRDIITRYEPLFKGRMKCISEKDAGIYDAMNKGIRLAKGSLIGIINSDDWYEENAVELVVNSMQEYGVAVYYGILRYWEDGNEERLIAHHHRYLYREHLPHPAYFVPKEYYKRYGSFLLTYHYASDYEFMMRLINRRLPFVQINYVLANYNSGGVSTKNGIASYNEYQRIRNQYGYQSKSGMYLRIIKNRIYRFFKDQHVIL